MMFSIVAEYIGIDDDGFRGMSDLDYMDVRRIHRDLRLPFDETEKGEEHDYSYLAYEGEDVPESSPLILARIQDGGHVPTFWEAWSIWSRVLTFSGVLDKEKFDRYIEDLGAYASGCETLGTLGGPLSDGFPTIVPDINFEIESQLLLCTIRVTPVPKRSCSIDEQRWSRIRSATLSIYGI